MREHREIAEKLGEARAKYERAQEDILKGESNPEVAARWAHEVSLLQWVLGDEWVSYPVVAPGKKGN